jgi:hypothetical protein
MLVTPHASVLEHPHDKGYQYDDHMYMTITMDTQLDSDLNQISEALLELLLELDLELHVMVCRC